MFRFATKTRCRLHVFTIVCITVALGCAGGGDNSGGANDIDAAPPTGPGTPQPADCQARCQDSARECGASPGDAAGFCADLCGRQPSESQLACLESLQCFDDPETCFATAVCTDDDTRCQGSTVETCASGQWTTTEQCEHGCAAGACESAGFDNPCPIPAEDLKVAIPYISLDPPTVVLATSGCFGSINGQEYEGYNGVRVLSVLEDRTDTVEIQNIATLFYVEFIVGQNSMTSAEMSKLAATVGFDASLLNGSSTIRSDGLSDNVTFIDYTLPDEVSARWFLPTSTEDGSIVFESLNPAQLAQVLSDLDDGIQAQLKVGEFTGSATYTYSVTLRASGSTKVAIDAIAVN